MRFLELSEELKKGQQRQRNYVMKYQVDEARHPPSINWVRQQHCFMRSQPPPLSIGVPHTLPQSTWSCNLSLNQLSSSLINRGNSWRISKKLWRIKMSIFWRGNEAHQKPPIKSRHIVWS